MIALLLEVLVYHLLPLLGTGLVSICVYLLIRVTWGHAAGKAFYWELELPRLLFVGYLACLLLLIWEPGGPPFSGVFALNSRILDCIQGTYIIGPWIAAMWVGYALLFLPLGFLLPCLFGRVHGRNILPWVMVIVLFLEVIQPVLGRSFDIDDLMCGMVGALLGFLLFRGLRVLRELLGRRKASLPSNSEK